MKDHPLPPMVQWRQSNGWDWEEWMGDKTTIWCHGDSSKRGEGVGGLYTVVGEGQGVVCAFGEWS